MQKFARNTDIGFVFHNGEWAMVTQESKRNQPFKAEYDPFASSEGPIYVFMPSAHTPTTDLTLDPAQIPSEDGITVRVGLDGMNMNGVFFVGRIIDGGLGLHGLLTSFINSKTRPLSTPSIEWAVRMIRALPIHIYTPWLQDLQEKVQSRADEDLYLQKMLLEVEAAMGEVAKKSPRDAVRIYEIKAKERLGLRRCVSELNSEVVLEGKAAKHSVGYLYCVSR